MQALADGTYQSESRGDIATKNVLAMGIVSPLDIRAIIARCNGTHHESSPHHQDPSVTVHVLRHTGWYIKFYFVDLDTIFISVHH